MPVARFALPIRLPALAGMAWAILALVLLWAGPVQAQLARDMQAEGPVPVADLAEELIGAVVNISTSQRLAERRSAPAPGVPEGSPFEDFFDDFFNEDGNGPSRENSLGSGFIIDAEGIIVTNNHVIAEADDIEVVMHDGRVFAATLVGADEETDLAVLRVEADEPLPFVAFAEPGRLRIGDWVLAIGNPFGLGGSVSLGIVSALDRDIGAGAYDAFIQTDAAINRGNSGGPLFDMNGQIVGVNTAILSPTGRSVGVGFAIPTETVESVVAQLVTYGETRRGLLGVNIQEVTPALAESLELDAPRGALVAVVLEDGPAAQAGIEQGDVIVRFNGRDIIRSKDLPLRVAQTAPGTQVPVELIRDGAPLTLQVVLALRDGEADDEAPDSEDGPAPVAVLGMELASLEEAEALGFTVPEDAQGVLVGQVVPEGPAQSKGIEPGMLILEVGQQLVLTPQDVVDRVQALREEGRGQILLLVQDLEGQSTFIAVPAD